jgi:hypothetical protein
LFGFGEHFEHVLSFVVVSDVLVGHIDVGLSRRSSSGVHVVNSSLRHLSQDLKKLRALHLASVGEKVSNNDILCTVGSDELVLQCLELLVTSHLLLAEDDVGREVSSFISVDELLSLSSVSVKEFLYSGGGGFYHIDFIFIFYS